MTERMRPTRADLEAARTKVLPDVLGTNLSVVFCGINPGLYSAAIGHHFGRPGNRFWPALHLGGFTDRLWSPYEDHELIALGFGLTNLAPRTTASAAELTREELAAGGQALETKLRRFRPRFLAVLGVTAYRTAFDRPDAILGRQDEMIGETTVWVLPSPSGLNAHHGLPVLGRLFSELRQAITQNRMPVKSPPNR